MEFTSSSFEATKKEDYSIDVDEFSLIKNICISDAAVGNIIFQVLYTSFPIHNRTPYVMEFFVARLQVERKFCILQFGLSYSSILSICERSR